VPPAVTSYRAIDAAELNALSAFSAAIAQAYGLVPNLATKASRDASVLGLLGG